jgi:8-oxo-dGTP pyrophosphatase MutT (NUDIX family)
MTVHSDDASPAARIAQVAPVSADAEEKTRLDRLFPKKRISAGALLRDPAGAILIVKPLYREHWLLPGGICESGESPQQALVREVREELGLDVAVQRLVCIDYLSPADGFGEAVHFLFECRPLRQDEIESIRLDAEEIVALRFASDAELRERLVPAIARRLDAIRSAGSAYCEDGRVMAPLGGASGVRATEPAR